MIIIVAVIISTDYYVLLCGYRLVLKLRAWSSKCQYYKLHYFIIIFFITLL